MFRYSLYTIPSRKHLPAIDVAYTTSEIIRSADVYIKCWLHIRRGHCMFEVFIQTFSLQYYSTLFSTSNARTIDRSHLSRCAASPAADVNYSCSYRPYFCCSFYGLGDSVYIEVFYRHRTSDPDVDEVHLPFFRKRDVYGIFQRYFLNLYPSKCVTTYVNFIHIWATHASKLKVLKCTRFKTCTTRELLGDSLARAISASQPKAILKQQIGDHLSFINR